MINWNLIGILGVAAILIYAIIDRICTCIQCNKITEMTCGNNAEENDEEDILK